MDLQIAAGAVKAVVSGSELYKVEVKVSAVPKQRWSSICDDSAGAIDSLVELLQGRFSKGVMERLCQQRTGLFPSPSEIKLDCSCPDWASMCKHVAAVLYGIGARLDQQPELLFKLREVDEKDLIARAGAGLPLTKTGPAAEKLLDGGDLGEIFGLEMASDAPLGTRIQKPKAKRTSTKTPAKKTAKTATAAKSKAGNRHNASAPRAGTPSAAKRRSLAKK